MLERVVATSTWGDLSSLLERLPGAKQRAGTTVVGGQEQHPNVTTELLDAQGQFPEMENLF